MEVMISEKDKIVIVKYGYKFRFHKMLKNYVQRWTCCKSTCKCFFTRHNDVDSEIYNDHRSHNKPSEQDINRQKLSNILKRKAVEEISVLPSELICRELQTSDVNTLTSNDTSLIKRKRNARSSVESNN